LLQLLRIQGYHTVYAAITLPNAGSVALHESLGFRVLARHRGTGFKLGVWHDVEWWELQLSERRAAPRPPQTPAPLARTAEWRAALDSGTREIR